MRPFGAPFIRVMGHDRPVMVDQPDNNRQVMHRMSLVRVRFLRSVKDGRAHKIN